MLKTYDLIKKLAPKLGEDEAKDLIYFVEETRGDVATKADLQNLATKADLQTVKADLQNLATKEDLQTVKADLQNLATKEDLQTVKADLQTVKADLEKQIQAVRTELKTEIQTAKSDLLKWIFGIWIPVMLAILTILIKGFLK